MKKQIIIGISAVFIFVVAVILGMYTNQAGKNEQITQQQTIGQSTTEEQTTEELTTQEQTTQEQTTQEQTTVKEITEQDTYIEELSVSGTKLIDKNGNAVVLKGVSTHGIAWYPDYVNYDAFKTMKEDWGINIVRLAMYTDDNNGYCVSSKEEKERLKELINTGVDAATDLGMYVIIDWHILNDNDPNIHLSDAKNFFEEMAQKYSLYSNVLYEICNEPNGQTTWQQIKSYANEIIPVIRKYDEESIILVGTPTWSQDVDIAASDPITEYNNIMYTLHFYAATHQDDLRNKLENAVNAGLPVFVTEYGICDASGNGIIDEDSADKWMSLMDRYGISSCIWNLSNKQESSALISSGCDKVSNWTKDELSQEGKWFVNMLRLR